MSKTTNQDRSIEEIDRLTTTDWDRAWSLAQSVSEAPGGMRQLVKVLGRSSHPVTTQMLVGCLSQWHEKTWKSRSTASLIVNLLNNIPDQTLTAMPEVVGTLLTIIERVSFKSYKTTGLSTVLQFVAHYGMGNSSRLKRVIIPQAVEVIRRSQTGNTVPDDTND